MGDGVLRVGSSNRIIHYVIYSLVNTIKYFTSLLDEGLMKGFLLRNLISSILMSRKTLYNYNKI
jgi:hypothetical protein